MAFSGQCGEPATSHEQCASCGTTVLRRSEHAHIYRTHPLRSETVCGECFGVMALCAIPIMTCAEQEAIQPSMRAVRAWLDSGRVAVLVTDGLPGF